MKDTILWLELPKRKKPDSHCLYSSIKDTGQWVERTAQLTTGEQSRLYFSFLVEINSLLIPAQKRLEILEQLHVHVLKLVNSLSRKCIGCDLPLTEEKKHLADLLDAFLNEMATGYKIIIDELADTGFIYSILNQKILHQSSFYALYYLNQKLFYNYLLYASQHSNEWLDIHQLYHFSVKRGFHDTLIKNISEPVKCISGLYKKILLFSTANPYHLSISEMTLLWNKLNEWNQYAVLVIPEQADNSSFFLIKPFSDSPPFTQLQLTAHNEDFSQVHLWGLQLSLLIGFLSTTELLENVPDYFRKRLVKVWSGKTQRKNQRQALIESVELVMGVSNISHFLGQHRDPQTEIHELYEAHLSSQRQIDNNKDRDALPVFNAFLVDESRKGCRLKINRCNSQVLQPRIDDVMAVKHQDGTVHVGYMRWIKENNEKELELGIEHLSSMAESVQLIISSQQGGGTKRGSFNNRILDSFVFPGGKAQHFKPVLFTHSFIEKFVTGREYDIKLIHKTGSLYIQLTQKVDEVLDYNLYLFDKADVKKKKSSQQSKVARFDSLWDKI